MAGGLWLYQERYPHAGADLQSVPSDGRPVIRIRNNQLYTIISTLQNKISLMKIGYF